jgi:hypothetical protein
MDPGAQELRLLHGRDVEWGPGYLMEGVWDGPFEPERIPQSAGDKLDQVEELAPPGSCSLYRNARAVISTTDVSCDTASGGFAFSGAPADADGSGA